MGTRKEEAQDAMDRALVTGVQQDQEKEMYERMEVCLTFSGWDFIVNDGSELRLGWVPYQLDVVEKLNEMSDSPETVKFVVISAPGMAHEDLVACLYSSYKLMEERKRLSHVYTPEKLRELGEKYEVNEPTPIDELTDTHKRREEGSG